MSFVASGSIAIGSGGYPSIVNAKTAPAPYQNGTAPSHYVFQVGQQQVTIDLPTLSVTVSP